MTSSDPALSTLTKGSANLLSGGLGSRSRFPLKMAAGLVMTIAVAVMFFLLQKRLMTGANAGAEK